MSRSRKTPRGRKRSGRATRRLEGHDAAQAHAEGVPPGKVPDHPLIPKGTPSPVTTAAGLAELVDRVREAGSFAYDTEFIGEETYYPKFCLIQIAMDDHVALIDPLAAGLDVTPVWELLVDPDVETVVHAGAQDLEPAARLLDRPPANIFDTQIATGFVGRPYPLGLRRLVQDLIGARLGKALTFTQWDRRPLSDVHLRYAADDVRYLPAVRGALRTELEKHGHTAWAMEECAGLTDADRYQFNPDARAARLVGNRKMGSRAVAVLRALVVLRDRIARDEDRPPRTVLKDDVLVRLARDTPKTSERIAAIKGMPRPFAERHATAIVDAAAEAGAGGRPPQAVLPDESSDDAVRIDSLWALASAYCHGRCVDPALVGNRRRVAEFFYGRNGRAKVPASPLASGWRYELIGSRLEAMMRGEDAIRLSWADGRLRAEPDPP